jgi:hypothetical protein
MALLSVASGLMGCRTNYLPEYMPKMQTALVQVYVDGSPWVSFGGMNNDGPIGLIGSIASASKAADIERRLMTVLRGEDVALGMAQGFQEQLQLSSTLNVVVDPKAEYDSVIEISVGRFGLESATIDTPIYFFVDADVAMVYRPENKLVWEYSTTIRQSLHDKMLISGGIFSIASASMNFSALDALSDDEMRAVLESLAVATGQQLVYQMNRDAR